MNKRHLTSIVIVLILCVQLLAACDSGSPTPTAVKVAPTATVADRSARPSIPLKGNQGGDTSTDGEATAPEQEAEEITDIPEEDVEGATDNPGGDDGESNNPQAEWTFLVYSAADDDVLESDMMLDMNEAELAGSTADVNIVVQVDRLEGTQSGWGNWTSAKRFLVQKKPNNDFGVIASQEVADLGEVNMADPEVLIDFITWGVQTYPAQKYAVILSDHGMGWIGCCSDKGSGGNDLPEDAAGIASQGFGPNNLWLMNVDNALAQVRANTGIDKFDLVGFDQCLMSQLEVYTAIAPHALYAVASEELEPSMGWAYGDFLGKLVADPAMDGAALSKAIVDSYIERDVLILEGVQPATSKDDTTLTAVDLTALAAVNQDLDALVGPLSSANQAIVAESRRYAQSYESPFGKDLPSSYVDLGNFLAMVAKRTESADVQSAIATLLDNYAKAVIAEKHGSERPGSTGISIYFPVEQEHNTTGPTYAQVAERFAADHLWDEYLQAHYTNTPLGDAAAPPPDEQPEGTTAEEGAPGPGTGDVVIAPIELSDTTAAPGTPVNLKTQVVGDKLAYLYFFVGHIVAEENLLITDRLTFVPADEVEEEGGVTYPVWPDGGLDISFDWEPQSFALTDGTNTVSATFEPEEYGDSPVYSVEGIYTSAKGQYYALLFFQDGNLVDIYVYTSTDDMGALTQITPAEGDTFTPMERGYNLDPNATEAEVTRSADGTLTYGPDGFSITEIEVQPGEYVVGFLAEDLDGQVSEQYADVTVP